MVYHFIQVNKEQIDEEVHLRNEHLIYTFVKCLRIILSKNQSEHDTHRFFFFFALKPGLNYASLADYTEKKILTFLSLESAQGAFPSSSSSHRTYTPIIFEALCTIGKN